MKVLGETVSQEKVQYYSLLADYNDRAFEIELESEANASRLKRQMVKEESELVQKKHEEDAKEVHQNLSIQRSQYISDARKQLMEKTKGIFQIVQTNVEIEIKNKIQTDRKFYLEILDKLIINTSTIFEKVALLSVNPADKQHVQSQFAKYKQATNIDFKLGGDLKENDQGVKIYNDKQTICVDSTIQHRVIQAMRVKAPEINSIVLPDVQLIE